LHFDGSPIYDIDNDYDIEEHRVVLVTNSLHYSYEIQTKKIVPLLQVLNLKTKVISILLKTMDMGLVTHALQVNNVTFEPTTQIP
jgi:hypothetical protein